MKGTTGLMRQAMSVVVMALRERMRWSQKELAGQMNKGNHGHATHKDTISGWERREWSPSARNLLVLAKIAARHGHEDLAAIFRALPAAAWELAAALGRRE